MFKKATWHFAVAFLLLAPTLYAQSNDLETTIPKKVWRINKPTVSIHKTRIVRQLIRNKYERVGIVLASSAVIVALGAYSLGGFATASGGSDKVSISATDIMKQLKITNARLTYLEQNVNQATKIIGDTAKHIEGVDSGHYTKILKKCAEQLGKANAATPKRYGWWMWEWAKRIGATTRDNFAVLLLMGGLPGPINKMFGFWGRKLEELGHRVYHDSDFHWFVSTQTHTIQYFNDLERAAALLPLANDHEEREHQERVIYWSASMLTKQLARVVAFMEYQAEKLKILHTGCSIQMQASARYIYRHVDLFATELHALLSDSTKHAEVPAYISNFRSKLRSEEESFCTNERAALYNISDETK